MDLFIDVGNTKTKWCLSSNEDVEKTGSIFNTELNDLFIKAEQIENVFVSSVNSETLEQQIIEKIKPLCPHIWFAKVNKQFLNTNYSSFIRLLTEKLVSDSVPPEMFTDV